MAKVEEGALPKHDGGLLCKEECNSSSCPEHDYTSAFLFEAMLLHDVNIGFGVLYLHWFVMSAM